MAKNTSEKWMEVEDFQKKAFWMTQRERIGQPNNCVYTVRNSRIICQRVLVSGEKL